MIVEIINNIIIYPLGGHILPSRRGWDFRRDSLRAARLAISPLRSPTPAPFSGACGARPCGNTQLIKVLPSGTPLWRCSSSQVTASGRNPRTHPRIGYDATAPRPNPHSPDSRAGTSLYLTRFSGCTSASCSQKVLSRLRQGWHRPTVCAWTGMAVIPISSSMAASMTITPTPSQGGAE